MRKNKDRISTRIVLRTLTPIFVGGGSESVLNRTRYIYDNQRKVVHVLNDKEWIAFLAGQGLIDRYTEYIKRSAVQQRRVRGRNPNANMIHLSDWLNNQGIKSEQYGRFTKYAVPTIDVDKNQLNDLLCFARDSEMNPYVPGSSIKGALRTVILKELVHARETSAYWNRFKKAKQKAKQIEQEFFYRVKFSEKVEENRKTRLPDTSVLRDIFRGVSVSDSLPIDPEQLYITRKTNLSTYTRAGSSLKHLPLYAEYLKPGTEVHFTLTLDQRYLQNTWFKSIDDLIGILDSFSGRISVILGEKYFRKLKDFELTTSGEYLPNFFLGGSTGFQSKVILPELAPGEKELLETTRAFLNQKFSSHKHMSLDKTVAPRTLKLASFQGKMYVVGLCRMEKGDKDAVFA